MIKKKKRRKEKIHERKRTARTRKKECMREMYFLVHSVLLVERTEGRVRPGADTDIGGHDPLSLEGSASLCSIGREFSLAEFFLLGVFL